MPTAKVHKAAQPSVPDARVRHRKYTFALAWAGLLEIGIDPAKFDPRAVAAYAKALLDAQDAF